MKKHGIQITEVDASNQATDHAYVPPSGDYPFTPHSNPDSNAAGKEVHQEGELRMEEYCKPATYKPEVPEK